MDKMSDADTASDCKKRDLYGMKRDLHVMNRSLFMIKRDLNDQIHVKKRDKD